MAARRLLALVGLLLGSALPQLADPVGAGAEEAPIVARPPAVEIVLDTSGSMSEQDSAGTVKIEGARAAVLDYLAGAEPGSQLGLLTYPSGKTDCGSGTQRVPLGAVDGASMSAIVRTVTANGGTPTGEALLTAKAQLDLAGYSNGSILLISDGHSTCAEKPCDVAKRLRAAGNAIQIDTVGFRVDESGAEELRCIADEGGGRYVGVDDVKSLQTQVAALSRPLLKIELQPAQQTVVPDAGLGAEGLATITAAVTNDSDIEARDTQVLLRVLRNPDNPAGVSPGFYQPLSQRLGNIAPHTTVAAHWSFRPGLSAVAGVAPGAGRRLDYETFAHADNSNGAARAAGSVSITQVASRADAGPLLKDAQSVVILGDSYSAGEGTGDYLPGQDEDPNHLCHRSDKTYLLPTLGLDGGHNLACSGAVTEDISSPNKGRDVRSQLDQLEAYEKSHRVDAAFMTMGGNDIGFADIIITCLEHPRCDELLAVVVGRKPDPKHPDDPFVGLSSRLARAYELITDELNTKQARAKRGGALAPLVILAYPRILPGADRSACLSLASLDQGEIDFGNQVIERLNGMIQATVEASRKQGVPVWFVPNTADSFLPDHTVCDRDSYARGLNELRALSLPAKDYVKLAATARSFIVTRLLTVYKVERKRLNELFHPKINGYAAMSLAVIRWSKTADGMAAANVPSSMAPKAPIPVDVAHPQVTLTVGNARRSVPSGATLTVSPTGFAPGGALYVTLHSDPVPLLHDFAGEAGESTLRVVLPARFSGRHDLVVSGFDPNGEPRLMTYKLKITKPRRYGSAVTGGLGLLLSVGCIIALRRSRTAV